MFIVKKIGTLIQSRLDAQVKDTGSGGLECLKRTAWQNPPAGPGMVLVNPDDFKALRRA
jgi:hypothetical protein